MQREIKFRAWDQINKCMYEENFYIHKTGIVFGDNDFYELDEVEQKSAIMGLKIMQFTGLYDKHNNPIYEGDIVKYFDIFYEIIFKAPSFGIESKEAGSDNFVTYSTAWEVVGNKFEHIELLKNNYDLFI